MKPEQAAKVLDETYLAQVILAISHH